MLVPLGRDGDRQFSTYFPKAVIREIIGLGELHYWNRPDCFIKLIALNNNLVIIHIKIPSNDMKICLKS